MLNPIVNINISNTILYCVCVFFKEPLPDLADKTVIYLIIVQGISVLINNMCECAAERKQ